QVPADAAGAALQGVRRGRFGALASGNDAGRARGGSRLAPRIYELGAKAWPFRAAVVNTVNGMKKTHLIPLGAALLALLAVPASYAATPEPHSDRKSVV